MSSPVPMFGTQNLKDDDGQVIDSFLIETDTPPPAKDHIEPIPSLPPVDVPRYTRVLGGVEVFLGGEAPRQIMPQDNSRILCRLDITSNANTPTFSDYVLIGDETGKVANVQATSTAFRARNGKVVDLDGHTGAVWVVPGPITNAIEVSWRSVTK